MRWRKYERTDEVGGKETRLRQEISQATGNRKQETKWHEEDLNLRRAK